MRRKVTNNVNQFSEIRWIRFLLFFLGVIQTATTQLQTDFDTSKIMFPIAQVAAAHRDVLALRNIENSLTRYRPGDTAYINFARNAGAILTAIG